MGNRNRTSADSEQMVNTNLAGSGDDDGTFAAASSVDSSETDDAVALPNGDGERIAFSRSMIDMSISVKHGPSVKL